MSIPTKMKAAVTCGEEIKVVVTDIPVPQIEPHQVLVKVEAAAANPTDWKSIDLVPTEGNVAGCDFAGTVVQVGSDVCPAQAKVGDRVAGLVHGAAYKNGAFAEYTAANADLVVPIQDDWTFEQAAPTGVAMYTACVSDFDPERTVLIWGGATSVGQATIQLARIVGLRVITTASEASFQLMRRLDAHEVFDYHLLDTPAKINELTKNGLKYVIDCISEGETASHIGQAIGEKGGKVAIILPYESKRTDVVNIHLFAYNIFGKDMSIPLEMALDKGQYEARILANEVIRKALKSGAYQPCPIEILPNGLESVNDGFKRQIEGNVRAVKLIYRISDTPALKVC